MGGCVQPSPFTKKLHFEGQLQRYRKARTLAPPHRTSEMYLHRIPSSMLATLSMFCSCDALKNRILKLSVILRPITRDSRSY